jgi:hypothetical protein
MSKPSRLLCVSRRLSLGEKFLKLDPGDWIIIQATGSSFKNSLPDSVAWTHYPGAWIYVEKLFTWTSNPGACINLGLTQSPGHIIQAPGYTFSGF